MTQDEIDTILSVFDDVFPDADRQRRNRFVQKLRETVSDRSDAEARMTANHRACLSVLDEMRKMFYLRDEEEILRVFLRNLVNFFGFVKGWYGAVSNDRIVPVYHAGPAKHLVDIETLPIKYTPSEFPLLTALRSRTPLVLDTLEWNPAFAPWSDFAAQAGVRAFFASPVEVDGSLIGGIVLYAGEEDEFDASLVDYIQNAVRELERTISEKRLSIRRQDELRQAMERAEDAARQKSRFLATMSHEIRTPMTAILGYAELLDDPNSTEQGRREAVRVVRSNSEYLLKILNDILDFSKIEAAGLEMHFQSVSLPEMLREIVQLYSNRTADKGIEFAVTNTTPLPETIRTDPVRLKQILLNLVSNAVKFTSQGGVYLAVSWQAETGCLKFDVTDTGIGMKPEVFDSLFTAFYQVGDALRSDGTGLGLAISHKLVELLGGGMTVQSVPDIGSTFSVTIPLTPNEDVHWIDSLDEEEKRRENELPTPKPEPRPLEGRRILFAEDDRDSRRLFQLILTRAGAELVSVENGQQALDAFHENPAFELVLIDMQMPVMDGFTAVKKLRESGFAGPVLALSAHILQEEIDRCLEAGCNDYVVKPVLREKLIAAVLRQLRPGNFEADVMPIPFHDPDK